jgi:tRNA pseudouridine38-40 synthase
MPRYKLTIEYNGTNFIGWQKQKKGFSIQGTIEKAAKNFLQSEVDLIVAGRTDAGVHAEAQVAHLDIFKKLKIKNILFGLNFYLSKEKFGEDISIKKVNKVDANFNARFGAKKKTYKYKIYNNESRSPMHAYNTWWVSQKLNIVDMKKASKYLLGNHDFSSFRASGCQALSPVKTLDKIAIIKKKNIITLTFTARSFLYNQVRIMTGTLKDVGSGLINPIALKKILQKKKRTNSGVTAPSKGLTLYKVYY